MGFHRKAESSPYIPRFVTLFTLLFLTVFAGSEDLRFEYEIRNNPVGVRDRIYVIILVDHNIPNEVKVAVPDFPRGVVLTHGPYRSLYADESSSNLPARTRVMYYLRGDRTGRFIIDPFKISVGEVTVHTKPAILEVGNYKNRQLYVPIEIAWEIEEKDVYVGQSVPVTLQLLNQREISLIESYSVTRPRGAFFEEIPGFGDIETVAVGSKYLYNIPVASFMFTPSQSGRLFIPAATVAAVDQSTESTTVRVDVKSLPADVRSSGAVGSFLYLAWIDSARLDSGSLGTLSVRVQGEGNLNYLNIPSPDFGDLVQTEKVEVLDIQPTATGYTGYRLVEYSYFSDTAGSYLISIPPFYSFDPAKGDVERLEGHSFRVTYAAGQEVAPVDAESIPFGLPSINEMTKPGVLNAYRNPLAYLWLIPAPLTFFVLLVLKRRGIFFISVVWLLLGAGGTIQTRCPDLDTGKRAFKAENYEGALDAFLRCSAELGVRPGLFYALSLTEFQLEAYDDAMFFVRSAIKMSPHKRAYWDYYGWLHAHLNLEKPIHPAGRLHPDVFLYLMIGLFSLGFLARGLYLLRRHGTYIVAFLLCMLLTAGSLGGLIFTAVQYSRNSGIVYSQDAQVRKIPSLTASEWISFPTSQSVRVLDASQDFYLVETGFGLKGWVEKNNILMDMDR